MENGQRKDADGKLVPRLIVSTLKVTYNDKPVLNARLEPAIAANPYLAFFVKSRRAARSSSHGPTTRASRGAPRARST